MKQDLTELKKVSLDDIIPYWRNPRNNFEAIEKVKESIQKFWYKNPILVDKNMTIVAGHTRYEALKQLWYKEAYVIVDEKMSEDEAKEYRLIDNKSWEYATRDEDKLQLELRDLLWDTDYMSIFFWDDLEQKLDETFWANTGLEEKVSDAQQSVREIENEIAEWFTNRVETEKKDQQQIEIICPKCFHKFYFQR